MARQLSTTRTFIVPPLKDENWGVFHSKLMILVYENSMRIVIGSANLVRQGLFMHVHHFSYINLLGTLRLQWSRKCCVHPRLSTCIQSYHIHHTPTTFCSRYCWTAETNACAKLSPRWIVKVRLFPCQSSCDCLCVWRFSRSWSVSSIWTCKTCTDHPRNWCCWS